MRLTALEREEFMAAARRSGEQGTTAKTGDDARDWLIAQGGSR